MRPIDFCFNLLVDLLFAIIIISNNNINLTIPSLVCATKKQKNLLNTLCKLYCRSAEFDIFKVKIVHPSDSLNNG